MNKQKFLDIIQSHVLTDKDDVESFQKIADQYPYSQIIHALLAKHHNESKSSSAQTSIQRAAIYATDRVVLKNFIEASSSQPKVAQKETSGSINAKKEIRSFKSTPSTLSEIDQLRKNLFTHLHELQESKKPFENLMIDSVKKKEKKLSPTKSKSKPKTKTTSKKKDKVAEKSTSKSPKKGNKNLSQKEQVDLIEKFIKSPPKITKGKAKSDLDEDQKDLSVSSTKIEENFASENLAQILIKQGNKDKAIDIYKKLIWKFPQKKAYFATQIEGLKK